MFLINLFKWLFIFLFVYLIYSLFKFIFLIGKNYAEGTKTHEKIKKNQENMHGKSSQKNKKDEVIELDRDQYKIE